MSKTQLFILALAVLAIGTALAVLGFIRGDLAFAAVGTGFVGTVIGYAFRDKQDTNGKLTP